MYGVHLIEIMIVNPKLIGTSTVEEVVTSIKQNLNMDFKQFFPIFDNIEGFDSSAKRFYSP